MKISHLIQFISAIALIVLVLLQSSEGGLSTQKGSYHTRQGLEKIILYLTIVFSCLFILSSIFALR